MEMQWGAGVEGMGELSHPRALHSTPHVSNINYL